jgi:hypothetical protein
MHENPRAGARVQAAAFLLVEAAYIWFHVKPLVPLTRASSAPQPDMAFLRCFTTGTYFASELALLWLLALCSPIRSVIAKTCISYMHVNIAMDCIYIMLA